MDLYTTADASRLSYLQISTPALCAQISNCSSAAALNVSPATTNTFFPLCLNLFASFAIIVVFPEPFTPVNI